MSARELREEIDLVSDQIRQEVVTRRKSGKTYLFDGVDERAAQYIENVRLGKSTEDRGEE